MTMLPWILWLACAGRVAPPNVAQSDTPLRVPVAEAFTFGPGDSLRISVWRHDDLGMDVTVAPDGAITYPLVGRIQVAGMTYEELRSRLQAAVSTYYVDAQVSVNVSQVTNQEVIVIGEVKQPMVLQLTRELSILEALARTGGIHPDARTRNVLLIRGGMAEPALYTVDVEAIYGRGDFSQMVYLQRGDIVYVPSRTITDVERFFRRIQGILGPAVSASAVYRNAVTGTTVGTAVPGAD